METKKDSLLDSALEVNDIVAKNAQSSMAVPSTNRSWSDYQDGNQPHKKSKKSKKKKRKEKKRKEKKRLKKAEKKRRKQEQRDREQLKHEIKEDIMLDVNKSLIPRIDDLEAADNTREFFKILECDDKDERIRLAKKLLGGRK